MPTYAQEFAHSIVNTLAIALVRSEDFDPNTALPIAMLELISTATSFPTVVETVHAEGNVTRVDVGPYVTGAWVLVWALVERLLEEGSEPLELIEWLRGVVEQAN